MNSMMRAALFDELEKIAEEKEHWAKSVAKGVAGVSIGAGLGTGAAMLAEKALPKVFLEKHPSVAPSMKIILPIVGAATSYVQQRLRERVDQQYRKAPGYQDEQ